MSKQNAKPNPKRVKQVQVKSPQPERPSSTAVSQPAQTSDIQQVIEAAAALQQTIGNQAVGRWLIQPKLTFGPVGGDELQMMPVTAVQRQGTITTDVEQSIQSARGSGQPLADNVRTPMENAFGTNFSGVKVHTDSQSDTLNQSLQARAFTTGQDIFFRQGEFNPDSSGGQELLAHELTHVVQQKQGVVQRLPINKNKLNVAGEEHGESQPRRAKEQEFSEEFFEKTGVYWKEAEFKPIEIFRTRGDEAGLRLKYFYWHFTDKFKKVILTTTTGDGFLQAVGKVWKVLNTVKSLYDEEIEDLSEDEGEALNALINDDLWTQFQKTMDGLGDEQNSGNLTYRQSLVEEMIKLQALWKGKEAIFDAGGKEKVGLDRDDHMHGSATAAAFQARVGIWKVGDNHVRRINENFAEKDRPYNTVRQSEFNEEYDTWAAK